MYCIDNILYATDLTPRSPAVFRHAAGLARTLQARLHVVTVTPPTSNLPIVEYISRDTLNKIRDKSDEKLRADLEARIDTFDRSHPELKVRELIATIQVLEGNPSQQILDFAKQVTADMIVLGSRGHSALDEMLMGSVAHRVVVKSDIPVVLVPFDR